MEPLLSGKERVDLLKLEISLVLGKSSTAKLLSQMTLTTDRINKRSENSMRLTEL